MTSIPPLSSIDEQNHAHDPRPATDAALLNGLLELACVKTAAVRLAILRFGEDGGRFETGYRMSSQLVNSLLPQVDFNHPWSAIWKVILGMKTYHCIVINLTGINASGRSMVALFEDASSITEKAVGRLEGIFNAWWHMAAIRGGGPTSNKDLLQVCSACQDVRVEGQGWVKWEDYLHRVMKHRISHAICDSCCGELYGELATRYPNSATFQSADRCQTSIHGADDPKKDACLCEHPRT
jgi:hypothetical protein